MSDTPASPDLNGHPFKGATLVEMALMIGAVSSGGLLGGAHIFQALGYDPCALCLDQRAAHWTALLICILGLITNYGFNAKKLAAAAIGAAALIYGFSALLSLYHTGVEFKFWPGPASCSGNGTIDDIGGLTGGFDPNKPRVTCGEAAWRFLGISMAGYNFLASTGLFALSFGATIKAIKEAKKGYWPKSNPAS